MFNIEDDIFTGQQAQQIDSLAINQHGHLGFELMSEAGEHAFGVLQQIFSDDDSTTRLLVLCGPGNNGGDGYVLARYALEAKWQVSLIAVGDAKTNDAQQAAAEFVAAGGEVIQFGTAAVKSALQGSYQVVVDALLGVGLESAPRAAVAELIMAARQINALKFAIDVPSGVNADSGYAYEPSFMADLTITFIVKKLGLLTGPALNYVGELVTQPLAINASIIAEIRPTAHRLTAARLTSHLSLRAKDTHKGQFGHVVVAGSDNGMLGASLLAGQAALRCGSGKVSVLSTPEHLDKPALSCPELMSLAYRVGDELRDMLQVATAVAVGPGLGLQSWGEGLLQQVLDLDRPTVIDADALTIIAREQPSLPVATVLTPHPGEAARLLECSGSDIQAERPAAAQAIARRYNATCVLKGAGTLVATAAGDLLVCDRGNPGMASAGMGDVLSGMIAAFLGQGLNPEEASGVAVWLHSAAADQAVESIAPASLIASDLIAQLPQLLASLG